MAMSKTLMTIGLTTSRTVTLATSLECTLSALMICVTAEAAVFTATAKSSARIVKGKENYEQTQRMETPDQRHRLSRQEAGVRRA